MQERALRDERRGVLGDGMDLERLGLARPSEEPLPGQDLDAAEPRGTGLDHDGGWICPERKATVGVEGEDLDVQQPVPPVVDGQVVDGRPSTPGCAREQLDGVVDELADLDRALLDHGSGRVFAAPDHHSEGDRAGGDRVATRRTEEHPHRGFVAREEAHRVRLGGDPRMCLAQPGQLELVNDATVVAHPDLQLRLSARLDADCGLREGRRSTHTGQVTAASAAALGRRESFRAVATARRALVKWL